MKIPEAIDNSDLSEVMPAKQAKHTLQIGARLGVPEQKIIETCGFDKAWFEIPDYQIPVGPFYKLNKEIAKATNNPDFGILVGRAAYLNIGHLLLYLSSICGSLRQWLNMMPNVLEMYGDLGRAIIVREEGSLRSEWCPSAPLSISDRYTIDMVLSTANSILTSICLHPITINKAQFTYPKPKDLTVLTQCFGSNLVFDQPFSALYFDIASLDYPLIEPITEATTSQNPWQQYVDTVAGDEFLKALRQSIVCALPSGDMTIDTVAGDLMVSRRTLQRRLSERSTNFLQEVQDLRSQMALRFLTDQQLGITSIAFLLGYADSSTFSSAFKTWHGCAPSEYRRKPNKNS